MDKIDAAQVWKKNGKTYFYRNEMFWRYNETSKLMDPGYPHHIKRWRGVPGDLDAATTWTDGMLCYSNNLKDITILETSVAARPVSPTSYYKGSRISLS